MNDRPLPSRVTVSVLGPLAATVDGRAVTLGGRGRRAVLARLASAGGRVVSTDLLVDDLWAGNPPPKALAALQVHVSDLRRLLEPDRAPRTPATVLVSRAPGYALALPADALDARAAEDTVRRAARGNGDAIDALDELLDEWSGEAYPEFVDTDWGRTESDRLRDLHDHAVELRAHRLLANGRADRAIGDLAALVHAHPARERASGLLALALYRTGRQAESLDELRRIRRFLADELGVDPSPELRAVEHEVRTHGAPTVHPAPALPAAPARPAAHSRPASATVVARPETDDIVAVADAAVAATAPHLVWIVGDAGAGKTTATRDVEDRLAARGWRTARGRCPEVDGAPPAWPWIDVLRTLGVTPPAASTPFAVAESVSRTCSTAPVLVILDDVHRADEPTLQILRQVCGADVGALVVAATYRPEEVTLDLVATRAALASVPVTTVHLGGVDRAGVAAIATLAGSPDLDEDVLTRLHLRTGGNPLFVREFAGLIRSEGPAALSNSVPPSVRDVIRRRLDRLPDRTAVIVRRAAILGREADLTLLAVTAGGPEDDVLDALEPAVLTGVLTETSADRVGFTHDLVREVVYESIPRLRRARAHRAALAVLADATPDDTAALAHHAVHADTVDAVPFLVRGAREAERQAGFRDADGLWAAAERLLRASESTDLLDVLVGRVGTLARLGDVVGAREARRRAVALAEATGDDAVLFRAATSWTAPVIWTIRTSVEIDTAIVDPLRRLASSELPTPAHRALVASALAFELEGSFGDPSADLEADAAAVSARRWARGSGDPTVLARACTAFGYIAFGPDHVDERVANSDELAGAAAAIGDDGFAAVAHYQRFLAAAAAVDLREARLAAEAATARAAGHQLAQMLGVLAVYDALVDVLAGRFDEARARYDVVTETLRTQGAASAEWIATLGRIGHGVATGDLGGMVEELAVIETVRPQSVRFVYVLALLDAGEEDRARAQWRDAAPYPRNYYWLAMTTFRARAAARLGDSAVMTDTAAQLRPFADTVAGLDSGSLYAGPVAGALAEIADRQGVSAAAARWRAAAAETLRRVREQLDGMP
ncbi:BTAD domain-containing putative transcriptional regulator [Rhodococcoides corynebacterioides]|uniref:Winged helix-turn-helix domain-containing protein n=1 Tax=Rhodococcoides corynebacterioides TaxID=53972 RepID=A0ABS7P8H7_9NOCA|nr:BTAD domain-containing putative transcriptional regulator [Rhodococcus corynebacterioides]MBY6368733.1 winged helix-turn-helix domain-containing protein [Rhodococcus corynebacterioides]MBY6409910.1 winged helix-turn-helix domain-containing protein [Rhodococcus corynebacterioides]